MQRNKSVDRIIVAGSSGDDPPTPHMGVSNMILGAILVLIIGPIEWVVTAALLYFSLKG
jgi:hypothetical protein